MTPKDPHVEQPTNAAGQNLCSICGKASGDPSRPIDNVWGNNAWPVNDGKCCDLCNSMIVTPRRIVDVYRRMEEKDISPGKLTERGHQALERLEDELDPNVEVT